MEDIKLWQVLLGVFLWIAAHLIMAAGIYGGIRADIRNIHSRLDDMRDDLKGVHKRVDKWYDRLDKWYDNRHHV